MRAVAVGVLAAGLWAGSAWADNAVEVRYGEAGNYSQQAVSVVLGELWSRPGERWNMSLEPVLEGGKFRYRKAGERDSLNYGSLGVGFRVVRAVGALRPYFELGIGGALFSATQLGNRKLDVRFQFTEWIGLGLQFSEHVTLGLRAVHFSNAGLGGRNHGLDMGQIVVGARF